MKNTNQSESDVLFQKLGDTWYAFTEVNENFVYSALPEGINPHETKIELFEVIEEHMEKVSEHYKTPEQAA
jgi:hypothetical protein